jgi:hypothetical protein
MRVTLENGSEQGATSWFEDELRFSVDEAVGLTVGELRRLHFERHRVYLQA